MHHYPKSPGDYMRDAAHLSLSEHGAYNRLLDIYYSTEKPLPLDIEAVARKAGAKNKADISAVRYVLSEFFLESSDGWRQKRADEEIKEYQEGAEEREQKKEHEIERKRRYRERRNELFTKLRELGHIPKWDARLDELERLLKQTKDAPGTRTGGGQGRGRPATGTAKLELEPEPDILRERENAGAGAEEGAGDWPAIIVEHYPRRDNPMESMQAVSDAIQGGESHESIRSAVKDCAALIAAAPGGSSNRYVPTAKAFFTGRQWRSPEKFVGLKPEPGGKGDKVEVLNGRTFINGRDEKGQRPGEIQTDVSLAKVRRL